MTFLEMKARFCGNIFELRLLKNLSLEALAQHSGVPLNMLEALDQGSIPEDLMLNDTMALATALGCKIHELFQ